MESNIETNKKIKKQKKKRKYIDKIKNDCYYVSIAKIRQETVRDDRVLRKGGKAVLREFVEKNHYLFAPGAKDWQEAVRMSCRPLEADGTVGVGYAQEIIDCVEKYGPYITIMPGVAIPHSQEGGVSVYKTAISVMKLEEPVSFDPEDPEKDAQLFFALASCDPNQHLDNMMRFSEIMMNEDVVEALFQASCPEDLLEIQRKYLDP